MRMFFILFFFLGYVLSAEAAVSSLVANTSDGVVFESKNAYTRQYPASLTKVMTLYLTFNALDNGLLKMDDMLPISAHAAKQPRSKLFLKRGDTIRVKDAIMALIIKSANDAAVVLAEALAPSEADFAKMMTGVAKQLGLKNTQFRNASGLHHPEQVTTARDMAVLTIALINHFPHYYKLFSKENFWYRGKEYKTHNRVTQKYAGAEGLKTGYVAAVGYNIISTAKRNNNRLVSVVIGQSSGAVRDKQVMKLLDKGFTAVKKPQTVLKKMQKQGKYASLDNAVRKPNMSKYLAIMKKRLTVTKKQKGDISKTRVASFSPSKKKIKQIKTSPEEEIEQGDNNEESQLSEETLPKLTSDPVEPATEMQPAQADNTLPASSQPAESEKAPAPVEPAAEVQPAQTDNTQPANPQPAESEKTSAPVEPAAEVQPAQTDNTQPASSQPAESEKAPAPVEPATEAQSTQADNTLPASSQPAESEKAPAPVEPAAEAQPAQTDNTLPANPQPAESEKAPVPVEPAAEAQPAQADNTLPASSQPAESEKAPAPVEPAAEAQPAQADNTESEATKSNNPQAKTEINASVATEAEKKSSSKPAIPARKSLGKWGIQVGAFANRQRAQTQAEKAQRAGQFADTQVKVTQNNKIYRARIYGFTDNKKATEACRKLKSKNIQCLPVL